MKKYIRAFDYIIASLVDGRKGNIKASAAYFAKALESKDVVSAIRILEANNKDAHKKAVSAAKRRLAAEDLTEGEDKDIRKDVKEDVDEDMEDDVDEEVDEDVDEDEDLDEIDEDEEEDDDVTASKKRAASFAKVLASMRKKRAIRK